MTAPIDLDDLRERIDRLPTLTMYGNESLRRLQAAVDELERLRARCEALSQCVRGEFIVDSTNDSGVFRCLLCDGRWKAGEPECHEDDDCLAAPDGGSDG